MKIRLIGSRYNLFESEESSLDYEETLLQIIKHSGAWFLDNNRPLITNILDFIVPITGLKPQPEQLGNNDMRNGYPATHTSFNRSFSMDTQPLFNHKKTDELTGRKLEVGYLFPYKYFTLGYKNKDEELKCWHNSELGRHYFTTAPAFVRVESSKPSNINHNFAGPDSKQSAHRIFNYVLYEGGQKTLIDFIDILAIE